MAPNRELGGGGSTEHSTQIVCLYLNQIDDLFKHLTFTKDYQKADGLILF